MRCRLMSVLALAILSGAQAHADTGVTGSGFDPLQVYGQEWAFDIYRNQQPVGEHIARFDTVEQNLRIESSTELTVSFWKIPVYRLQYRAVENWRDGKAISVEVSVADGGDKRQISARQQQELVLVDNGDQQYQARASLFTTNHWHPGVIEKQTLLNTLTGNLNQVTLQPRGWEEIVAGNGVVNARRFDYQGELRDTTVWYDAEGRWVGLAFIARDGSTIEYRCRACAERTATGKSDAIDLLTEGVM